MLESEAVLIVNTASRRGRNCFEGIKDRLQSRGVTLTEAHDVRKPAQLGVLVRAAISAGRRLIVLGGGDGTVTSVAGAFAHSESVLGLIPIGTGNSFARGLNVPLDLTAAVDTIVDGRVALVDLATVNGITFANAASIGLSTLVSKRTPPALKRVVGPLAYVLTGIVETLSNPAFRFTCDIGNGAPVTDMTHQIIVANGRMFGTTPISPNATLYDSSLSLYALRGNKRSTIAKMWLGMLAGGLHTKIEASLALDASAIVIETLPTQSVDLDGELTTRTPARFAIEPKALRMMVPAEAPEAGG